ncbi:hypothetical protein NL676_020572 [Syzygium grande]|nr:hypothetical protein NL676_020572 [Syzygium grande]
MTHDDLGIDGLNLSDSCNSAPISEDTQQGVSENDCGIQITCFSEVVNDSTLHFQIIRLQKQIYAWIGCNSLKLGRLYAAASTRPANLVSVTSIFGGVSDNTGSGIARRSVIKTGLNIILACNIPKNNPMLEADAERLLIQKLVSLGYRRPKPDGSSA